MRKVLFIDDTHPVLKNGLTALGFTCDEMTTAGRRQIEERISGYEGIVIRSRLAIDKELLQKAVRLKFIARAGAGLENIDTGFARSRGIRVFSASEGNRNAVGEHTLGLLLALLNRIPAADKEVKSGQWRREENRGEELDGKTAGIIGYGNMGKAFARKLAGFDLDVICYDIKDGVGDDHARQVTLEEFFESADIVSLHVPITPDTFHMVNAAFIRSFHKKFYLINTARGEVVHTGDLVDALKSGAVKGAALDVLEYEKKSFENFFDRPEMPEDFDYLVHSSRVILTPHIAGWTVESKERIAAVLLKKIQEYYLMR